MAGNSKTAEGKIASSGYAVSGLLETKIPDLNPCLSKLHVSTPVQGFNFLFRND